MILIFFSLKKGTRKFETIAKYRLFFTFFLIKESSVIESLPFGLVFLYFFKILRETQMLLICNVCVCVCMYEVLSFGQDIAPLKRKGREKKWQNMRSYFFSSKMSPKTKEMLSNLTDTRVINLFKFQKIFIISKISTGYKVKIYYRKFGKCLIPV